MAAVHESGHLVRRYLDSAGVKRQEASQAVVQGGGPHAATGARPARAPAIAPALGSAAARSLEATLQHLDATRRHSERLRAAPGALAHALATAANPVARALWPRRTSAASPAAVPAAEAGLGHAYRAARFPANQPGFPVVRHTRALAPAAGVRLARPGVTQANGRKPATQAHLAGAPIINSAPTVIINSSNPGDIEHRVLEALRRHRHALFDQWRAELQKRARTEF